MGHHENRMRHQTLFFILSFLLHAALLIIAFSLHFEHKKSSRNAVPMAPMQLQNSLPAQLRARQAQFGWVLYQPATAQEREQQTSVPAVPAGTSLTTVMPQAPATPSVTLPSPAPSTKPSQPSTKKIAKKTASPQPQQHIKHVATKALAAPIPPAQTAAPTLMQPSVTSREFIETAQAEKISEPHQEAVVEPELLDDTHHAPYDDTQADTDDAPDYVVDDQQQTTHIRSRYPGLLRQGSTAQGSNRGATRAGNKNIIGLTRGFIDTVFGGGNDDVNRHGDPHKKPSFDDLKFVSYTTRVWHLLQATWKQHYAHANNKNFTTGKLRIEFSIGKSGTLDFIKVIESSGNAALDKAVQQTFILSSPFPPIPDHLSIPALREKTVIRVYAEAFR